MRNALICICAVGLTLWVGAAGAQVDPRLNWRTLQSEHFNIHYPEEMEPKARRALAIAEHTHARLSMEFEWRPWSRTEIVLTDQFDLANGFASPLPYNFIYLFATPPDGITSLADYDDWFDLLITHEYTHTLHLDKAHGFHTTMRRILGRNPLFFPNLFQPIWMIEGLAVHKETDTERGIGRGQSTLFDMWMRMEVADGIKTFDQVGMTGVTEWPHGHIPYLYGAYFFQFVEEVHGPERVQALVRNYSGNVIPFLLNRNLRRTLGSDGEDLWQEFADWLAARFHPQLEQIEADGLREGERLTRHGYQTNFPRALPDGRVIYVREDAERKPALMLWHPEAGALKLTEIRFGARLDVHPHAGGVLALPEICRNRNLYYDLYHVDLESGRKRRLTRCQRYRNAAWSPDGTALAASRIEHGQSRLDYLDDRGRKRKVLWQGRQGEVLGRMDWSPDGQSIVASVWRPGRGWALERLDLAQQQWETLTEDATIEGDPVFTPDGGALLFSSEHGGVYNLRRMDLASGEIVSLSNVRGGAFSPTQAGEGEPIYYVGYTPDGYDLFRLAPGPVVFTLPEGRKDRLRPPANERMEAPQPKPYSPWPTLMPRAWAPVGIATEDTLELGAMIWGSDVLGLHEYSLAAVIEVNERIGSGMFSYNYADRLFFSASRWHDYHLGETAGGNTRLERAHTEDAAEARLTLPFLRLDRSAAIHIGASRTREHDRFTAPGITPFPDLTSGAAGLAFSFDSTERYLRGVSRTDGRRILLVAESNEVLGSDYNGNVYTLDWQEYLSLGRQHVLGLRAVQGWGTDAPRPFRLGGPSAQDLVGPAPLFDRRRYALRGYRSDFFGNRMRLFSGEWNFPLYRPERSFTRVPFGLHQLAGQIFVDSGATWDEGSSPEEMLTGAGFELISDLNALYLFNFRLRLGYARGLDEGGERQGYLLLDVPFGQ
jgi:hypothetical protein